MEAAVVGNHASESAVAQAGRAGIVAFGGPLGIRWEADAKVTRWGGLALSDGRQLLLPMTE